MRTKSSASAAFFIACTMAADHAAQDLPLPPGSANLLVLSAGQRSANLRAGEGVLHSGDYRAGEIGGPARARQIESDDLYIIDAWLHVHGYWSISAARSPSPKRPNPRIRHQHSGHTMTTSSRAG